MCFCVISFVLQVRVKSQAPVCCAVSGQQVSAAVAVLRIDVFALPSCGNDAAAACSASVVVGITSGRAAYHYAAVLQCDDDVLFIHVCENCGCRADYRVQPSLVLVADDNFAVLYSYEFLCTHVAIVCVG